MAVTGRVGRAAARASAEKVVLALPLVLACLAVLYASLGSLGLAAAADTPAGGFSLLALVLLVVVGPLLLELAVFIDALFTIWGSSRSRWLWLRFWLESLCAAAVFVWFSPVVTDVSADWCVPLILMGNVWLLLVGLAMLIGRSSRRIHVTANHGVQPDAERR